MATLLTVNSYHYRRGGAEVACLAQAALLEAQGWKVASFSMTHPDNIPSPWSAYFVSEIEYGREYGWPRLIGNAAKSVYSWESVSKVKSLVRQVRPDVAHAHNVYHHLSPSVLKALKQEGIPVFLTLHDVKLLCPARTMLSHGVVCEKCKGGNIHNVVVHRCMKESRALSALIFVESAVHRVLRMYENNVDKFVSPSRFVLEKFLEWGWPPDRFVHIPNFIDAESYCPNYTPGRAFLYFGRLSEEKGVSTLISAASLADVPLWIVGTGPAETGLRALAREKNADVKFWGFRTGEALWSLVRGCRAVVLPSEWYENAPISILEAYALGKPVIGARIGGIPEMIRSEETGHLYKSKDIQGLASILGEVATAPDQAIEEYGRHARAWVCDEYSPARHYGRLRDLYASCGVAVPQ